jgi:hypothetical protein
MAECRTGLSPCGQPKAEEPKVLTGKTKKRHHAGGGTMANDAKECLSCRSPFKVSNGRWVRRESLDTASQAPDVSVESWFETGGEPEQPLGQWKPESDRCLNCLHLEAIDRVWDAIRTMGEAEATDLLTSEGDLHPALVSQGLIYDAATNTVQLDLSMSTDFEMDDLENS